MSLQNTNFIQFPLSGCVGETTRLTGLVTFLVGGIDTFPHLFFTVGVHIHIRKDPGLVGPQVVVGAKEVNRELANIMPHPLDVLWDSFWMADFCWPPPLQSRRGRCSQRKKSKSVKILSFLNMVRSSETSNFALRPPAFKTPVLLLCHSFS